MTLVLDEAVSDAFAHGGPGFQIYRLQQREIGERLMAQAESDSDAAIFRYSEFRDMMAAPKPAERFRVLRNRSRFLLENVDSELWRATHIQNALVDLLDFIDEKRRWVRPDERQKFSPTANATSNRSKASIRKKRRVTPATR